MGLQVVVTEEKDVRKEKVQILIFLNMTNNLDYQPYSLPYLDYCHTLVAVSRLARLHAISYFCSLETSLSDTLLSTGHEVPTADRVTLDRLEIVLGDSEDATEVVDFIRAIDKSEKENNLDIFGVFCPGNLNVDNLLFCCSSYLESRLFCSSMVFKSVSSMCFDNCVIDLLRLLFTCVNQEVRRQFLTELVCSIYYEHFAVTVKSSQRCSFLDNLRTN